MVINPLSSIVYIVNICISKFIEEISNTDNIKEIINITKFIKLIGNDK